MATVITAPDHQKMLIGIDPTSAERWDDCPGKYEAIDVLQMPNLSGYSSTDTGLCTHAAIHRLNHDLLDMGSLTSAGTVIADTIRGHRFKSDTTRLKTQEEIGLLVDQYLAWRAEHRYRILAAELSITTTAQALPQLPRVRAYLTGRIDFLGVRPNGTIVLVDYKTGTTVSTGDQLASRLSTIIYCLLALHHCRRCGWESVDTIEVGQLCLRAGIYTSTTISLAHVRQGQERIVQMASDVAEGRFTFTPGNHCKRCPRVLECPAFNTSDSCFIV